MMKENYNHKEAEENMRLIWEKNNCFSPKIDKAKKPFSIFLVPPNASGPLHIGNALMIATQDILTRYHRAKGSSTLWTPCTDHGGYETQVSFEREIKKTNKDILNYDKKELFSEIKKFVETNNAIIKNQIKSLGASVDWSRFRFTMDDESLRSVNQMFKKMAADNLIYRRLYMVNYCPLCSTFLADIELKETEEKTSLYYVKFGIKDSADCLALATARPEFLFSVTNVLVHPSDQNYSRHIGKTLINPITGNPVEIVASKRKLDPEKKEEFLSPFCPSFKRYDFEYALRHSLPYRNLLDWRGNMIERYPGLAPAEARIKEISLLEKNKSIEKVDNSHTESLLLCKKGHITENLIVFTWFLRLDDKTNPLRKPAVEAIEREGLVVFPKWRKKGLVEWMSKMHDWPIARQNVWGIKIPVWYDVSEPEKFIVWFTNRKKERLYGNLNDFLEKGINLEEISEGLERVYAGEGARWVLEKEPGKPYLPETDTFDTWFSSGQWATIVFDKPDSADFSYFYPSDSIIIGHDLLRLSVARKILLSLYETKTLPFKIVYLHPLLKGKDGQKMSKSLGNTTSLEYYLEKFGADATRMALVSYLSSREDFYFSEERLKSFRDFSRRLWHIGRAVDLTNDYNLYSYKTASLSEEDKKILSEINCLSELVGSLIKKYMFSSAQEKACGFLSFLEKYAESAKYSKDVKNSMAIMREIYEKYLIVLHPFMPFTTEELYRNIYRENSALAAAHWPVSQGRKAFFQR